MSWRIICTAFAATALLGLAGCSSSSGKATAPASATAATTGTNSTGSAAAPAPSGNVSVEAAAGSIPVIAEQKGLPVRIDTGSFTSEDSVTVGVNSLKVDPNGTTMTLRLVFTPSIRSTTDPAKTMSLFATSGSYPVLLDRTHLKRYRVINYGNYGSDSSDTKATDGKSFEAWFGFAAPQDSVSALELSVNASWPAFLNVPVQR
jgi:hypothetical protein